MCEFNPSNAGRRIDPCIREFMKNLELALGKDTTVVASCCGHGRYPMTVVVSLRGLKYDLVSGKYVSQGKKIYRRDQDGFYYIPEVVQKEMI